MMVSIGCLMISLLSQVEVQTNFIFVVKSLYFQNDWLARKTINHLTQDFGKKERDLTFLINSPLQTKNNTSVTRIVTHSQPLTSYLVLRLQS